jgi:hypothetical protein
MTTRRPWFSPERPKIADAALVNMLPCGEEGWTQKQRAMHSTIFGNSAGHSARVISWEGLLTCSPRQLDKAGWEWHHCYSLIFALAI